MADDSHVKPMALMPRAAPTQARARLTRQKILDATHRLLKERGVHGLTTVAIAEAGGMSVGALYRFFPNKEAIVCCLYEEKLARIRQLGLANRVGAPGATAWRDFFRDYLLVLKAVEREVDFDFSLADAIFMLPQLNQIDRAHGLLIADQIVGDMRLFGSPWSDAALFDLAVNLYALEASTWAYWRHANQYPTLAIARLIEASLCVMRPAMEGDPEPPAHELAVTRQGV
jgi:AcrR family transcriptional regulator